MIEYQGWTLPDAVPTTSLYAVDEARRNLPEPEQLDELGSLVDALQVVDAGTVPPSLREGIELPEKDWPIVAGALEARATHLITGDVRDFGPYFGRHILGVLVLSPGGYLARARAGDEPDPGPPSG